MEAKHYQRHYEDSSLIPAPVEDVFDYIDDHSNYYSHVIKFARLMGGDMEIRFDDGSARRTGSHVYLEGKLFGKSLSLEEVITDREPPHSKSWETVGVPKFLIIGQYRYELQIEQEGEATLLRVSFSYDPPSGRSRLRRAIGDIYAEKCAKEMVKVAHSHFASS